VFLNITVTHSTVHIDLLTVDSAHVTMIVPRHFGRPSVAYLAWWTSGGPTYGGGPLEPTVADLEWPTWGGDLGMGLRI